ncbi:DUF262 domain-containing protein [Desulfococcaceae bacterium HSG9]|nr:DUF262 domain-containing protein [Desulfococcaceae bacterium HSG9]
MKVNIRDFLSEFTENELKEAGILKTKLNFLKGPSTPPLLELMKSKNIQRVEFPIEEGWFLDVDGQFSNPYSREIKRGNIAELSKPGNVFDQTNEFINPYFKSKKNPSEKSASPKNDAETHAAREVTTESDNTFQESDADGSEAGSETSASTNSGDTLEELAANGSKSGVELEKYNPFPFDAEKISITNKPIPLATMIHRLGQKTITAPQIQRRAGIWDDGQQSRFIESLMLKIPVPIFYMAEDENGHWKIVDGLQRVTTIKKYVLDGELVLKELEFLRKFESKKFDDLPQQFQNRILETTFQFAIINPSTPQNVQRNVFNRLNTGGIPLNQQEIRHALYSGPLFDKLLDELVRSEDFKTATAKSVDDSRMGGCELILRFFAFLIHGVESYPKSGDMDGFLSVTMQIISFMPKHPPIELSKIFNKGISIKYCTYDKLRELFYLAMKRSSELFDKHAFRKAGPTRSRKTPINKSLFETWSVLLSEMEEEKFKSLSKHKERLYELLEAATYHSASKEELSGYISRESHTLPNVRKRYQIFNNIITIATGSYDLDDAKEIINKKTGLENALDDILNNNMEDSHD